jgi:hypothetical protein
MLPLAEEIRKLLSCSKLTRADGELFGQQFRGAITLGKWHRWTEVTDPSTKNFRHPLTVSFQSRQGESGARQTRPASQVVDRQLLAYFLQGWGLP